MEYITFIEQNKFEDTITISFLQYTDNEIELEKLDTYIHTGLFTYSETCDSDFEMDLTVKCSEDTVDSMCRLPFGLDTRYNPNLCVVFRKLTGAFRCTFQIDEDEMERACQHTKTHFPNHPDRERLIQDKKRESIGRQLHRVLIHNGIDRYFSLKN